MTFSRHSGPFLGNAQQDASRAIQRTKPLRKAEQRLLDQDRCMRGGARTVV